MNTKISTALIASLLPLIHAPLLAVNYTATDFTTNSLWSDPGIWSPEGGPPTYVDNVSVSYTGSGRNLVIDGNYSVNNMSVTPGGGSTLTFTTGATTNTTYSLDVLGTFTKQNGSGTITFQNDFNGRAMNVSIATLNYVNEGGGGINFGQATGGRGLNALTIGTLNMGGNVMSAALMRLNVSTGANIGLLNFAGTNTKDLYLNSNDASYAGSARTVTVGGISQSGTGQATLYGSARASTSANSGRLIINTEANTSYSAATILADGTGGTLRLTKTGEGTQVLTGALNHTGGTFVEAGTLVVSGSLGGDVKVSSDAVFFVGNELTVANVTLQSAAILGFDLDEGASLSLTGDLIKDGSGSVFSIDFGNTGVVGQTYDALLSITGSAGEFAGETISFVNFGAEGISGSLSFAELTNGFTVSAIPEPSSAALLAAGAVGLLALGRRRR